MKGARLLFVGPSLRPADLAGFAGLTRRPPVARDDILRAIGERPVAIGIVDGFFGDRPSVWHKEILEAMHEGIAVFGAASMGALRAAELHPYGMRGVGRIFRSYLNGELVSDAAVAVAHAPAEFDFAPLSIAQVDVDATLRALVAREHLSHHEAEAISAASAGIFYADRSWRRIARAVARGDEARHLERLLEEAEVEAKRLDAIELLQVMAGASEGRSRAASPAMRPPRTPAFRRRLESVRGGAE